MRDIVAHETSRLLARRLHLPCVPALRFHYLLGEYGDRIVIVPQLNATLVGEYAPEITETPAHSPVGRCDRLLVHVYRLLSVYEPTFDRLQRYEIVGVREVYLRIKGCKS